MKSYIFSALCILQGSRALVQEAIRQMRIAVDEDQIYSEVIVEQFVNDKIDRTVVGDQPLMALPPVLLGMARIGWEYTRTEEGPQSRR